MSIDVRIQAKAAEILKSEAVFYGVSGAALAKAIIDVVVTGGITRDILQGVDVASYCDRKRGRPRTKDK